jgi:hypothetical protein
MNYNSTSGSAGSGALIVFGLFYLVVVVVVIAGMWKTFVKAGKPGWAAIVPFYNVYVLFEIAQCPTWYFWGFLGFIVLSPITVGLTSIGALVLSILAYIRLAKAFDKSTGFAVGLILLSPIFICILGFGDARYNPAFDTAGAGGFGGYPPQGGYPGQGGGYPVAPVGPGAYQTPGGGPYGAVAPSDTWGGGAVASGPGAPAANPSGWGEVPQAQAPGSGGSVWGGVPGQMGGPVPPAPPAPPVAPVAPVAQPAEQVAAQPQAGSWFNVNDDPAQRAWWDGSAWSNHQRWDGNSWVRA